MVQFRNGRKKLLLFALDVRFGFGVKELVGCGWGQPGGDEAAGFGEGEGGAGED